MKKAVIFTLLMSILTLCSGLSSHNDSPDYVMDMVDPLLELSSPNGGESYYSGETVNILWAATDTNLGPESIELWYSLNSGVDYASITEAMANTGSYAWELPAIQSLAAKVQIQVSDLFGNSALAHSLEPFSIICAIPAIPEGLSLQILNGVDILLSWDEVTQTIPPYNSPITPDGYIIFCNQTPYEDAEHLFYSLGESPGTSYTHIGAAASNEKMFYRVRAYKNDTRHSKAILKGAKP